MPASKSEQVALVATCSKCLRICQSDHVLYSSELKAAAAWQCPKPLGASELSGNARADCALRAMSRHGIVRILFYILHSSITHLTQWQAPLVICEPWQIPWTRKHVK